MVDDNQEGPNFAAWYLLTSILDNPQAECLIPGFVERVLRGAGFIIQGTATMLTKLRNSLGRAVPKDSCHTVHLATG